VTRPQLFARLGLAGLGIIAFGVVTSMMGSRPEGVAAASPLEPCPDSPNCYSTSVQLPGHPRRIAIAAKNAVRGHASWRTGGWSAKGHFDGVYRVESTFRVGFVFFDDVVIEVTPVSATAGLLHIRSASRIGRSDLGVNRARVRELLDKIREELKMHPEVPPSSSDT
jgi:uncharacterized protein (DUF1499 family)